MARDLSSISKIAVCGIGQMGSAAAVCFERAGFDVLLWARNAAKLAKAQGTLDSLRAWSNHNIGPPPQEIGNVYLSDDLHRIDIEADLVMECISEEMNGKVDLLRQLTQAASREAIFISATSGLSITQMGRLAGVEHLLVGAHFWNPPHLMPLVEVIRGDSTPFDLFDVVCRLIESIGKTVVRVNRDVPGFIGNRLLHAMWREAIRLVQDGVASVEDIDRVARLTFALRLPAIGPFENMDLIGLDLVASIQDYLLADLADDDQSPPLLRQMVSAGLLGVKSGKGFYDWGLRDARQSIDLRDRQIVRQLAFLSSV